MKTTQEQLLVKYWQLTHVTKETIEEFLFSQCKQEISDEQKALFIWIALANNLNPFKREIYAIPFWNTKLWKYDLQPVTGYGVYLQRAQQSGKLNWRKLQIDLDDNKKVIWGKITIHRKDRDYPFEREVLWSEIVQTKKDGSINKNRNDMPEFMTKKTLIAQGMRLCFPEDIWGMPYVDAEIIEADLTENTSSIQALEWTSSNTTQWETINTWLRVFSIKDNYVKKAYTKKEVPTAK